MSIELIYQEPQSDYPVPEAFCPGCVEPVGRDYTVSRIDGVLHLHCAACALRAKLESGKVVPCACP